ncbi:MAG: hypothetical protein K2Q26_04570 [Bdellovibrionales bacterium]|nr:hypothetical protein [Bdellovibrionales bacterium]
MSFSEFLEYVPYALVDSLVYALVWGAIILILKYVPTFSFLGLQRTPKEVSPEQIQHLHQEIHQLREDLRKVGRKSDEESPSLHIV